MPKKIKKRSKRQEEEEVVDVELAEGEGEDFFDAEGEGDAPEHFGEQIVDVPESERDAFQKASFDAANWVEKNLKTVGIGLALAIAIPVGAYAFHQANEAAKTSASEVANGIFTGYQAPIKGSPAYEMIESNDKLQMPKTVYPTTQAKWAAIEKAADETLSEHPDQLGTVARLSKGAAALRLEKWDDALEAYEGALAAKDIADMKPFALLGVAQANAGAGKVDGAVKALDELAEIDGFKGVARYEKGRAYERAGDKEKAKAAYHDLLETQPSSPYKIDVERRLATL
jgi:tetratricopeptide (TPR) repeat protein